MLLIQLEMAKVAHLFSRRISDLLFLNRHSSSPIELSAVAAGSFMDTSTERNADLEHAQAEHCGKSIRPDHVACGVRLGEFPAFRQLMNL